MAPHRPPAGNGSQPPEHMPPGNPTRVAWQTRPPSHAIGARFSARSLAPSGCETRRAGSQASPTCGTAGTHSPTVRSPESSETAAQRASFGHVHDANPGSPSPHADPMPRSNSPRSANGRMDASFAGVSCSHRRRRDRSATTWGENATATSATSVPTARVPSQWNPATARL